MRLVIAGILVVLIGGCADKSRGSSDCGSAIRHDGIVYVEAGFVKGPAQPLGQADDASCDDMGEDAQGAYFPADPRRVEVSSFEGQDTAEVLGVLGSDGRYRVFVAEDEDPDEKLRAVRMSQNGLP